jgi:RNA 2',3'-cyclic 3'-phosphodiesterase
VASKNLLILLSTERLPDAERFQKILTEGIKLAGLPLRRGVRFNPHITLSYQHGNPFEEQIDSFSWLAEEFLLIHSHIGLTRHDVVGRWPLGANGSTPSQKDLFAER